MSVNYYYDHTENLTQDTEGNLVMLCREHARLAKIDGHEITWAAKGDEECQCEWENCEVNNNPEWSAEAIKSRYDL